MNITVKELLEAKVALEILSGQRVKSAEKEARKLAYKIVKNIDKINQALREYEFNRQELLHIYAEKDDKGNTVREGNGIKLQPARQREFSEKINDEQAEVVDVEIRQFSEDEIQEISNKYELSMQTLAYIEWMIAEGEAMLNPKVKLSPE
jgi:hypothetical protein